MVRLFFFISLCIAPLSILAQYHVVSVNEKKAPQKEGVYYALPRNGIRCEITYTEHHNFAGPYVDYASKYLGLEDYVRQDAVAYEIESIRLSTYSEADPDQYYYVVLGERTSRDKLPFILATDAEGVIKGFGTKDNMPELAGYAYNEDSDMQAGFIDYTQPNLLETIDTVIRKVTIDTATIEDISTRISLRKRTTQEKAQEAAEMIQRLEKSRMNLLTGFQEVPYPAGTLQYMDQELFKLHEAYVALFKGVTKQVVRHKTYWHMPLNADAGKEVSLFRFSAEHGVSDIKSGKGDAVRVFYSVTPFNEMLQWHVKQNRTETSSGINYRIPRKTKCVVLVGNKIYAQNEMLIGQFGVVTHLPVARIKEVQIHPQTGMIMKLEVE